MLCHALLQRLPDHRALRKVPDGAGTRGVGMCVCLQQDTHVRRERGIALPSPTRVMPGLLSLEAAVGTTDLPTRGWPRSSSCPAPAGLTWWAHAQLSPQHAQKQLLSDSFPRCLFIFNPAISLSQKENRIVENSAWGPGAALCHQAGRGGQGKGAHREREDKGERKLGKLPGLACTCGGQCSQADAAGPGQLFAGHGAGQRGRPLCPSPGGCPSLLGVHQRAVASAVIALWM